MRFRCAAGRLDGTCSASNTRSFAPINLGIGACIQNATLKIGAKTICETDDWNHFNAYKSLFLSNEVNKEREQYLSSRLMSNHQFMGGTSLDNTALALDNGKEYVNSASGTKSGLEARDCLLVDNKGVFSVTLEELFPLFKATSFPLFMLNQDMPLGNIFYL